MAQPTLKELTPDVLIIGAGPAGLTAAIYTARAGKKTIVLKGKTPSHLELAHSVENYPGVGCIAGKELLENMTAQAKKFGAKIIESDALELSLGLDPKMVTTRGEFITAQAVILAMGKGEHKKNIKNEELYLGTGLSYCAICDGAFFRGKKVVVYGSDHEAVDDAQMLQQLGCQTTLITYCQKNKCPEDLLAQAKHKGVTVIADTEIIEVNGAGVVQSITVNNGAGTQVLETSALFIIQAIPSSSLLSKAGVTLINKDCVAINRQMETNIPGVYAAGDITCGGQQIAISTGEGTIAALSVLKYLRAKS